MKIAILTLALSTLAACSSNQAPQGVDNTPGTKTLNEYKETYPCSTIDSRRGACKQ